MVIGSTVMPTVLKYHAAVGDVFGRRTVIATDLRMPQSPSEILKGWQGHRAVLLRCSCPKQTVQLVSLASLFRGVKTSCGCFQSEDMSSRQKILMQDPEYARRLLEANIQLAHNHGHGLSGTSNYTRWANMMYRCYDSRRKDFHNYGGRGITVQDSWHDVTNFIAYIERGIPVEPPYNGQTTASSPPPGYSFDRTNNDGSYQEGNVRWADTHTQLMNRRPRSI